MTFLKDPERNETKLLLKTVDFENKVVLEIGCGEGRLSWRYASETFLTFGIDPDKNALRVAAIDRPAGLTKKVHFANAKAEHLPFRKEIFDIAILAWSL